MRAFSANSAESSSRYRVMTVPAVLVQEAFDAGLLREFRGIIVQIQGDDRTAVFLLDLLHLIGRRAVAAPLHGLRALLPGKRLDGDLLRDHERAVESEAEMADDAADLVLVFLQELARGRERDLVDVLVHFLPGHADAFVDDLQGLLLLIQLDTDLEVSEFSLAVAGSGERLQFLGGVHRVRDQLAKENLMVGIQELLDDGENVLGGYTDLSFVCHMLSFLDFSTSLEMTSENRPPQGPVIDSQIASQSTQD